MTTATSLRELTLAYVAAACGVLLCGTVARFGVHAGSGVPGGKGEESWYEIGTPQMHGGIPEEIWQAALAEGVDPALVAAIVQVESGFNPKAFSEKGAVGLMQVLPETAMLVGVPSHHDPEANLRAGCRYLRLLFEDFGGDVELVLAAYNAGPGAVYKSGGIPPYRETQTFVQRVKEAYRTLNGQPLAAAKFGFWAP